MKRWTWFPLLLCVGLALGPTSSAVASCFYDCVGSLCYDYSNNTPMCLKIRADCEVYCRNKRAYGAIAYSVKDEAYGWSEGWDYQDEAEKVALEKCSKRGSGCKIIVWFYNSCAAVAADGEIVTWGRDSTNRKAEERALAECVKAGGKNCVIKVSRCSR